MDWKTEHWAFIAISDRKMQKRFWCSLIATIKPLLKTIQFQEDREDDKLKKIMTDKLEETVYFIGRIDDLGLALNRISVNSWVMLKTEPRKYGTTKYNPERATAH